MTPKRQATFRIDDEILQALNAIKEEHGIPVSDQVDRALQMWLDALDATRRGSERKERVRRLETLTGVGEVVEEGGKSLGPRPYHLTVFQQVHRIEALNGSAEEVPGLKSVQGTVRFEHDEAFTLVGKSLILTLEDGRRFPFFLRHTNGAIAARGGFQ